jgi:hypothetical protein
MFTFCSYFWFCCNISSLSATNTMPSASYSFCSVTFFIFSLPSVKFLHFSLHFFIMSSMTIENSRGCFCKRYIGLANNLREADVIVMSRGVAKLFQFILYFLLIKRSFYSICLTENNVLECRFLLRNTIFYRLLQHNLQYNTTKLNLGTTTENRTPLNVGTAD